MAVGDVVYNSNVTIDGSDGQPRVIVTVGGKKIALTAAAIQMLVAGATTAGRDAMGIPGKLYELSGEDTLGNIDYLSDGSGSLPEATLSEVITRVNLLIKNYNTLINYGRNNHLIVAVSGS